MRSRKSSSKKRQVDDPGFEPPRFNDPDHPTVTEIARECVKIKQSFAYFLSNYCYIQDKDSQRWIRFDPWPAQSDAATTIQHCLRLVILKARQLGFTWLCLCYIVWLMITRREQTVLMLSIGLTESKELMVRLQGIYKRLPAWMRSNPRVTERNAKKLSLSNGMKCISLPANSGDSYTASLVLYDEFDLVYDQERALGAVQPTIEDGGSQLILLSRVDKSRPNTPFKRIYRAAKRGQNSYTPLFVPWSARPTRDVEWYEEKRRDALANHGHLDDLYEQYPTSEEEALAPRSQDKRIPLAWLKACLEENARATSAADDPSIPDVPGLLVYEPPARPAEGARLPVYTIGGDPAEGNPNSDESAFSVMNEHGRQVAICSGKFEPGVLATYIADVSDWYYRARVLVERNNHGHAVILKLRELGLSNRLVYGRDGRAGWLSSPAGKTALYNNAVDLIRSSELTIRDPETFYQLAALGTGLHAPDGENDDRADALALNAMAWIKHGLARERTEGLYHIEAEDDRQEQLFGLEGPDSDGRSARSGSRESGSPIIEGDESYRVDRRKPTSLFG